MVEGGGRWFTSAFNPAAYWVEMSVVPCLGLGHYLLSLGGSAVVAVGSFPLFLLPDRQSGWLPTACGSSVGSLLCVSVAAVGTICAGVVGYRW